MTWVTSAPVLLTRAGHRASPSFQGMLGPLPSYPVQRQDLGSGSSREEKTPVVQAPVHRAHPDLRGGRSPTEKQCPPAPPRPSAVPRGRWMGSRCAGPWMEGPGDQGGPPPWCCRFCPAPGGKLHVRPLCLLHASVLVVGSQSALRCHRGPVHSGSRLQPHIPTPDCLNSSTDGELPPCEKHSRAAPG